VTPRVPSPFELFFRVAGCPRLATVLGPAELA
jgi:hypothetical protein